MIYYNACCELNVLVNDRDTKIQLSGSLGGENKFRTYSSLLQQTRVKNYYKQNIEVC